MRVHETVSIHTKKGGTINRVKIPYTEMKGHDMKSIAQDVKRICSALKNPQGVERLRHFVETNAPMWDKPRIANHTTISSGVPNQDRAVYTLDAVQNGMTQKSIVRDDGITRYKDGITVRPGIKEGCRDVNTLQSIEVGLSEKSIIKENRDHFATIHPTQKPVRLLERLLALVTKEGDMVLDPFAGSFSTGEACINTSRRCVLCEIDSGYYDLGTARIRSCSQQKKLF